MTGKALPAVIAFVIIIACRVNAHAENSIFSAESMLSFTEHLVEKGEYYRAWTELQRLGSFYPDYLAAEKFRVTEYYLYYKSGRYNEILSDKNILQSGCPEIIFIADSCIMMKDFSRCESILDEKTGMCGDASLNEMYKKRRIYLALISGSAYDAGVLKPEFSAYSGLAAWTESIQDEKKSPLLAALLGIIPGLGYVYAGDSGTGAVAFTVTGICGAVTYASFRSGIEPLGILAGAVTLFFYGGNIAGGYLQTEKYNMKIDERIDAKLRAELDMNNDADRIYIRFGISSHGR